MIRADRKYFEKIETFFLNEDDKSIFKDLVEYSQYLYESLYRYNGESYLTRSLRLTVEKILPLNPDMDMLIASVLISAMYSPRCDLVKISDLFGKEVRAMVESLGKINAIKSRYSDSDNNVIAKMFLTLASDIRVILIRLMDRIDNLETLEFKAGEKQKANAKEILDVYVPIASQLGLYEITLKLEDLAFKYIYPDDYYELKAQIDEYLSKTSSSIAEVRENLLTLINEAGFDVEVSGRIKSVFSIFNKLKKKTKALDDIFDVYAMRIILRTGDLENDSREDIQKLYAILSLLHSKFESLSDRFKDYVAHPKSNNYQSLHTAIVGLNSHDSNKPTEIQIRTEKMHYHAEYGLAAHWVYKGRTGVREETNKKMIEALSKLRNNLEIDHSRTAALKMNIYPDRIFVLTPKNLVKDLPKGATPVDFAYSLSSELGHTCYLAKVNGVVKSLDHKLNNGDVIEILTDSKLTPKLSWLRFVITKNARNLIRNFFRSLSQKDLLLQGIEEVNELLSKSKLPKLTEDYSFLEVFNGRKISIKEREALLESVGKGEAEASSLLEGVRGMSYSEVVSNEANKFIQKFEEITAILPRSKDETKKSLKSIKSAELIIGGESDIPYKFANCCKPKQSDEMIAFVTKSNFVTVHKKNCAMVKEMGDERLLDVRIGMPEISRELNKYQISLLLEIDEKNGYIKQLVDVICETTSTIIDFSKIKSDLGKVFRRLVIDVRDDNDLQDLIDRISGVAGVLRVSRL